MSSWKLSSFLRTLNDKVHLKNLSYGTSQIHKNLNYFEVYI